MIDIKRILLVEDDPRDIELTLRAFEEQNLANEVVIAEDGEEALDLLFQRGKYGQRLPGNPAVVLMDLKLPKIDGLEVLRQIRADEKLKWIPVVALTSSREERDLIESYHLGVNAFVVKPVNFADFFHAVKEIGLFWAVLNEAPPGSANRIG